MKTEDDDDDIDFQYDCLLLLIQSPNFKNPIEKFKDFNCIHFPDTKEHSHYQYLIHEQFKGLINILLDTLTNDWGIGEDQFLIASQKGLKDPENKQYFEELINFTDFDYFNDMMIKRNKYIEQLAYQEIDDYLKNKIQTNTNKNKNKSFGHSNSNAKLGNKRGEKIKIRLNKYQNLLSKKQNQINDIVDNPIIEKNMPKKGNDANKTYNNINLKDDKGKKIDPEEFRRRVIENRERKRKLFGDDDDD